MPVMREGQKRTFSLNPIKISENLMQEILIYSGSFYFNSIEEQEQFLNFIFYVPNPRTEIQTKLLDDLKLERNGFVLAKNRKEVFGEYKLMIEKRKWDKIFQQDPSKFIIELISSKSFSKSSCDTCSEDTSVSNPRRYLYSFVFESRSIR